MIRQIQAEFRKLFTIRSTYFLLAFCLVLTIFFAFYVEGYKSPHNITDPNKLVSEVTSAVTALAFLISLVGVLLITHEYRYNTIMYTLTSSSSRLKVLVAKVIAVSCFAVLATLLFGTLSPLLTMAGVHLKGLSMVHQVIPYGDLLWRVAFFGWSYSVLSLFIAFIIRSQVGAIVTLLFAPSTVESLLTLLLKHNAVYLPFTALSMLLNAGVGPGKASLAPGKAALTVGIYLVTAGIVAAWLFRQRDAV